MEGDDGDSEGDGLTVAFRMGRWRWTLKCNYLEVMQEKPVSHVPSGGSLPMVCDMYILERLSASTQHRAFPMPAVGPTSCTFPL